MPPRNLSNSLLDKFRRMAVEGVKLPHIKEIAGYWSGRVDLLMLRWFYINTHQILTATPSIFVVATVYWAGKGYIQKRRH